MDELLSLPWAAETELELGRDAVKSLFGEVLDGIRMSAREGETPPARISDVIEDEARRLMEARSRASLRAVVNATGVVVHTNLGRSPLPGEALDAVASVARGYSTLEYSLESGGRSHRNAHVEWLLCRVTGAESALVVNNNAGAVLLALTSAARGREVVVSRGELVEIGGAFRIPDILSFSGAKMVEVGCTNCTRAGDYRSAITDETALLLKVHPSNFRMEGFTESAARSELVALARESGVAFMEDLGSGLLEELGVPELGGESTVRACIDAGVDVVTFSGDKLLGGPQIGCIAGSRELIDGMRRNQLIRALRVDKMCLAAFETILRMYLKGNSGEIPTVNMLRAGAEKLRARAEELRCSIEELFRELSVSSYDVSVVGTEDAVGGGSFPAAPLPGWGVALRSTTGVRASHLADGLRNASTPVIAGISCDSVVLHVRTLWGDAGTGVLNALREAVGGGRLR
jgi:L-seryl-tRNA(Ser) seleniumtransferase